MILAILGGCATAPDAPIDVRVSNLPDGDHIVLRTPEVEIPASSETMWCSYGTWDGGDVGIAAYQRVQSAWGHHLRLLFVDDGAPADDTVIDCTGADVLPLDEARPVFFPSTDTDEQIVNALPAGMATPMGEGQRYVLENHVVNTSEAALLVSDVVLLSVVEPATVSTWASPWIAALETLSLPPAQSSSASLDCAIDEPIALLFVRGHQHEWGAGVTLDRVDGAGLVAPLYDSGPWQASYREAAPTTTFWDAPELISAGSTLRTNCQWFNDTDDTLQYPAEMCEVAGMKLGTEPWICRQ
ncbi:hypothetical protein LBMAG42_42450 [Deltaproteobacteria bacterium]|nr:hypothetical protein LBMAG42_42450 [Deltaproteobacteria bacterium]